MNTGIQHLKNRISHRCILNFDDILVSCTIVTKLKQHSLAKKKQHFIKKNKLKTNQKDFLWISDTINIPWPSGQSAVSRARCEQKCNNSAKYLGVLIDSKLNFKSHASSIEHKITRSVSILFKLKSFLPKLALLKLYIML